MSRKATLKSINCTGCGAGLDVLGGGRVQVHVCPYCGSELAAQENYRRLGKLNGTQQVETPFNIGMTARLRGIDYTLIGLMEQQETWAGKTQTWVDHQLYSPTHGYVWLTLENGHLTLCRRIRTSLILTSKKVERATRAPIVRYRGQFYKYYETCIAKTSYIVGEFSYRPRVGERSTTVTAISPDQALHFTQTGTETEVELSTYVTRREAEKAFGQTLALRAIGVHPEQPIRKGPNHDFLRNLAVGTGAVSLLVAVFMHFPSGQNILRENIPISQLPVDLPFTLSAPAQLVRITTSADVNNSWAYIDMEVTDPEDEVLFAVGRTMERYSGRDSEGSWREGSGTASFRFFAQQAGEHILTLEPPEAETWPVRGSGRPLNTLSISIQEGQTTGLWSLLTAAFFFLTAGMMILREILHRKKRWAGTDWFSEDD